MKKYLEDTGHEKKHSVRTYRDELRSRDAQAVNNAFSGGAFGCPGEYFQGAAARDCRGGFRVRCARCWSRPYTDEEWIPAEKRDG